MKVKTKKRKIRLKCRHEQFSLSFYLFFSFLLFNHISCLSALNLIISLMREKQVLDTLKANIHSGFFFNGSVRFGSVRKIIQLKSPDRITIQLINI